MLVDIPRSDSHFAALDGGSYASSTSIEGRRRAMDSGVVGFPNAVNPSRDRMEVLVRSITLLAAETISVEFVASDEIELPENGVDDTIGSQEQGPAERLNDGVDEPWADIGKNEQ